MTGVVERLDEWGPPAWITLMVVSFIVFWPLGLALLAFLIWSGRMGCRRYATSGEDRRDRWERKMMRLQEKMDRWGRGNGPSGPTSGNWAFDEYRAETLKRLEEEEREFRSFLERLRHAKDKSEFDQFMADRRNRPASPPEPGTGPTSVPPSGGPQ